MAVCPRAAAWAPSAGARDLVTPQLLGSGLAGELHRLHRGARRDAEDVGPRDAGSHGASATRLVFIVPGLPRKCHRRCGWPPPGRACSEHD